MPLTHSGGIQGVYTAEVKAPLRKWAWLAQGNTPAGLSARSGRTVLSRGGVGLAQPGASCAPGCACDP